MDLYKLLELERNATADEIKKSYRRLAMKYHPDRTGWDKEAEAKFKEINEAYSVLSDVNKRAQYDQFGSTSWAAGWNPFGGWFGGGVDVDFGDIFESFFGGNAGWNRRKKTEFKGEDLEYQIHIDLKTSIYWGKETLKFQKRETCTSCEGLGGSDKKECSKCWGNGQVTYTTQSMFGTIQQTGACGDCEWSGEKFSQVCSDCHGKKRKVIEKNFPIDIPAGIDNGMVIKIAGEWNDGVGTLASGALYVKFSVDSEEKGLKRDWVDLYYELEIDVLESILGTKKSISIPIIWKRQIEIKPWTQAATIIKLANDGVKHINSDDKWDLFITLLVKIPKKLTKKEREHYESIADEKKIDVNKGGVFTKIFG